MALMSVHFPRPEFFTSLNRLLRCTHLQNKRIMIRQVSAAMHDLNINNGIIRLFRQQEMVYDNA